MTLPLFGPLAVSGFSSAWFFLFLLAVAALVAGYVTVQLARQKRVMRFANMELLERVAPASRTRRWRHVPVALLVAALALLTTAMAGPTHDVRIPRNRAVVMLVIDVSESMVATDVAPSRLEAAKEAGKRFADELTPGISLGLVEFAAQATLLISPTTDRDAVKRAIDTLQAGPRTATGEGIYTALQAIATVGSVMGGGDGPPPARIVLESDGKETVPSDPADPGGAFPAAQAAKEQHVAISTIAFGTPYGVIDFQGEQLPVPVDDDTLKKITDISGGRPFHAGSLDELKSVYDALQQDIGYQTIRGDASQGWIRLGALVLAGSILAAVLINRRLPS
ncbi:MAG: VWA domain-containing protein [Mycobacteriaceae bacterium]|nr:VWA domain-containing protein [Mycobacteriaceae bacterium]MBV9638389.1 VWA domain-containing protein [Mycobacteriaceae bacterium]